MSLVEISLLTMVRPPSAWRLKLSKPKRYTKAAERPSARVIRKYSDQSIVYISTGQIRTLNKVLINSNKILTQVKSK